MHARTARPNVLLVIVDDLRADRLGYAGHPRARTPHLDAFAASAVRYDVCYATCGWTLPSCASIITGRLPSGHGLIHHDRRFGAPKIPALLGDGWASFGVGNNGNLVPDDISRERLDAAGFERRPEVWKHFGWQEGFESYEWFYKSDKDGPFATFADFLESRPGDPRPWFAMVHTNIVHDYDRSDPWCVDVEDRLGAPLPEGLHEFRDGPGIWLAPPDGLDDASLSRALQAKYDGCVTECDRRLGDLLARVDRTDTLVVIVSDHGEGFDGEADRVHHCGRLHDDLLRVPLLVAYPDGTPGAPAPGSVVTTPVSTLDVAATILAVCDRPRGDLPGADLRDPPEERTLRAEDFGYLYLPQGDVGERLRRYGFATHDVASRCTIEGGTKSIAARIGRQEWAEEYDLDLDPEERINRTRGAQGPVRRPRREEGAMGAAFRALGADSAEARRMAFPSKHAGLVRKLGKRRRLPPVLSHRPFAELDDAEPITFIVAVDDPREFALHVTASECFRHAGHQWLLVENRRNRAYTSIARLYTDALERAEHDLVFFVHQDVIFPPDWEERLFAALHELESTDPAWGVIGAAGRAPWPGEPPAAPTPDDLPKNIGHWSDPHGYHKPRVPLPARVQVLDELWLGVRRSSGVAFDPELPGFHCYGADLCLTARAAGRESYVIDAPVIHKLYRPDGSLIERSDQSHKIAGRRTDAFRADFLRSADFVARKWPQYLPLASTCHVYV